jgi:hypothetical protein
MIVIGNVVKIFGMGKIKNRKYGPKIVKSILALERRF